MRRVSQKQCGFSLVELAIVIAIIGLLAGGLMAGQNMIHNAKVAKIPVEKERIVNAISQFSSQYDALPGDMTNATRYWGEDVSGCPDNTNRVPKKETCNGNGDGKINPSELLRAWQHIANAGIWETTYTGVTESGNAYQGDVNAPAGPIESTFMAAYWVGDNEGNYNVGTDTFRLANQYKHNVTVQRENESAFLTVDQMYGLDKKFDDSGANTGKLVAAFWQSCTDATSHTDTTVQYDFNEDGIACGVIFTHALE